MDSLSYGLEVVSPGSTSSAGVLSNASVSQITISNYGEQVAPHGSGIAGVYGVWAGDGAFGSLSVSGLTVNGTAVTSLPTSDSSMADESANFVFTF
jgi:hypothetical protein